MNRSKTRLLYAALIIQAMLLLFLLMNRPEPVHAQSQGFQSDLFLEPGTQMLVDPTGRQSVLGKVVIDLTTGNVWGFPTYSGASYPTPVTVGGLGSSKVPVSKPFLLAKYDFGAIRK